MQFLTSKTGILTTLLIALFAFLYFFTGVFGDTRIGITLRTNPDLENGLVGYWSFDGNSTSLSGVEDISGNSNDGVIHVNSATTTEVLIDSSVITEDELYSNTSPTIVWTSETEGFVFYIDATNGDVLVASTTDSGGSWSYAGNIINVGFALVDRVSVWYDRWNEDDSTGDLIHVLTTINAGGGNDTGYVTYNTVTNATSTGISATNIGGTVDETSFLGFTRATGGRFFAGGTVNGDSRVGTCTTTCTTGGNWSDTFPVFGATAQEPSIIVPTPGTTSAMILFWDDSSNQVEYSEWTGSGWTAFSAIATENLNTTYRGSLMGATVDNNLDKIYLAYVGDANDYVTQDHDIEFWVYENGSWTAGTAPVTNASGGLISAKLALDEYSGDLYVVYGRRTTIGTATTGNIYYKISKDGGTTWGSEQGPVNDTPDNIYGITTNLMSQYRIGVSWKYDTAPNANDLYYATIADLEGDRQKKGMKVVGKIGQGIKFDGVNDSVDLGDISAVEGITALTVSAWIKNNKPSLSSTERFISKVGGGADTFSLGWNGGEDIFFDVRDNSNGSNFGAFTDGIPAGRGTEWYNIVGVYDGSEVRVYVNAELGETVAALTDATNDTPHSVRIGNTDNDNALWDGLVDDVRIYDRALSVSEIKRLYELGATAKINKTLTTNPDLQNGLVGLWTFDGGSVDSSSTTAEVRDSSGSGIKGNVIGNSEYRIGNLGQSLYFDGVSDAVAIESSAELDDLDEKTVCAWINPETISGQFRDIVNKQNAPNGWIIYLDSTDSTFRYWHYFSGSDLEWSSGQAIGLNEWQHVCVSYDRTSASNAPTFYIDGQNYTGTQITAPTGSASNDAGELLTIGAASSDTSAEEFLGSMDNIRVYNRILSDSEILRLYGLGATTKINKTLITNPDLEDGLVGHWTFDGGNIDTSSTTAEVRDSSESGIKGNIVDNSEYKIGALGQSLYFDGVSDAVVFETSTTLDDMDEKTICAWINPETITGQFRDIVDKYTSENGWIVYLNPTDSTFRFWQYFSGSDLEWSSDQVIGLNEWQHVCVSYDRTSTSNTPTFYVDGQSYGGSQVTAPTGSVNTDVGESLTIGAAAANTTAEEFLGKIDDVRIYNRILTASEISRLYQLGN